MSPSEASSSDDTASSSDYRAAVRTVLFCDLVDSTGLVERLGDRTAAELLHRHDRLARELIGRHEGVEIDKSDGFLVLFDRPFDAVEFALAYHRSLDELVADGDEELAARVAIHLGEVFLHENPPEEVAAGAKPLEVEGLAKPMAARLLSLARPGQTLLTGGAFDLARRASQDTRPAGLRWIAHGPYLFQGVSEPIEVYEVGVEGEAPLESPSATEKAWPEGEAQGRVRWRRRLQLAAVALVVVALAAVGIWLWRDGETEIAFEQRDWIVVGDFENRTANPVFDHSLDYAFRAGFEQSRYALVMPEARVRAAVQRMEYEPGVTIDRDIGCEVCLRENAKALTLGSIAQVGGEYRLAGELVDPQTSATIFSETAMADEEGEVLEALDVITRGLRSRLGESINELEQSSVPLEHVTTEDLEALKLFSLGTQKVDRGVVEEGVALIERAIERDPEFAVAHAKLGTVYFAQLRDDETALRHWGLALEHSQRLAEREKLRVEASKSWADTPTRMAKAWSLFRNYAPESWRGHAGLGFVQWWYRNRFSAAAEAFRASIDTDDPAPFTISHNLGYCQLALGEFESALETFEAALAKSPLPMTGGIADAYVALRRYEDAERYLRTSAPQESTSPPWPYYPIERRLGMVTSALDRGDLTRGLEFAEEAARIAADHDVGRGETRAQLAVAAIYERLGRRSDLMALLDELSEALLARLEAESPVLMSRPVPELSLVGKLLARNERVDSAVRILDAVRPLVDETGIGLWRAYEHMLSGEIELAEGRPGRAVERYREALAVIDVFELHESLARAYEAADDLEGAIEQRRWLLENRGRALAEWTDWFFGRELHVIASARARWHLGRLEERRGNRDVAFRHYRGFLDQWSGAGREVASVRAARRELGRSAS